MKLFFWRRSGLNEFAEAIQPELRSLSTPDASEALLQRILASREAGSRIILPLATQARRKGARRLIVGAVAAAILLIAVPVVRQARSRPDHIASVSSFLGPAVSAQRADGVALMLPPVRITRPNAIRPLLLEFARRVRDSSGKLNFERGLTLAVVPEDLNGTPAWRVTSVNPVQTGPQRRISVETLYVARADLRLLRRAVHVTPYSRFQRISVQQQFQGDSVTGRMTTDGPSIGVGRAIARVLPARSEPYMTDAMAPLFFMSVPLSEGWTGSASLLGWAVRPEDVFRPIELRVEGEERVIVPAGEFDCWRLSIQFDGNKISYWVRKSDGLGVRLYDDSQAATPGIREVVLGSVR